MMINSWFSCKSIMPPKDRRVLVSSHINPGWVFIGSYCERGNYWETDNGDPLECNRRDRWAYIPST